MQHARIEAYKGCQRDEARRQDRERRRADREPPRRREGPRLHRPHVGGREGAGRRRPQELPRLPGRRRDRQIHGADEHVQARRRDRRARQPVQGEQGRALDHAAGGAAPHAVPPHDAEVDVRPREPGDAVPPALPRPHPQRADAQGVRDADADHQLHPPLPRHARLPRGRDADVEHDPGRRDGEAVRHPPQRPQPRPVHADRPRALPQGARRRRPRPRVRDRPALPQRGDGHDAQPRVHHVRVLLGVRRLQRPMDFTEQMLSQMVLNVCGSYKIKFHPDGPGEGKPEIELDFRRSRGCR